MGDVANLAKAQSSGSTHVMLKRGADPNNIIGLPPNYRDGPDDMTEKVLLASVPVCRLIPAWPSSTDNDSSGLHLYSLDYTKGAQKWRSVIDSGRPEGNMVGFNVYIDGKLENKVVKMPQMDSGARWLDVAYINETSFSETFSQDYGASKFEDMANIGSQSLTELRRITGKSDAASAIKALKLKLGDVGGIAGMMTPMLGAAEWAMGNAEGVLDSLSPGLSKLLSGSKVDFPAIWQNASYQTGYSIMVRLYNPMPANPQAYVDFILHPLLKLLAFVIPISDSSTDPNVKPSITYSSPVACSAYAPGLWELPSGFISSIEVIKGGEANDISWEQRPNMIDLRVSFGELYGVMTSRGSNHKDRPTLQKYMTSLTNAPQVDLDIYTAPGEEGEVLEYQPRLTAHQQEELLEAQNRVDQTSKSMQDSLNTQEAWPKAKSLLLKATDKVNTAVDNLKDNIVKSFKPKARIKLFGSTVDLFGNEVTGDDTIHGSTITPGGTSSIDLAVDSAVDEVKDDAGIVKTLVDSGKSETARSVVHIRMKQGASQSAVGGTNHIGDWLKISDDEQVDLGIDVATGEALGAAGIKLNEMTGVARTAASDGLSSYFNGTKIAKLGSGLKRGAIGRAKSMVPNQVTNSLASISGVGKDLEKAVGLNPIDIIKTIASNTVKSKTGFGVSFGSIILNDTGPSGLNPADLAVGYGQGEIAGAPSGLSLNLIELEATLTNTNLDVNVTNMQDIYSSKPNSMLEVKYLTANGINDKIEATLDDPQVDNLEFIIEVIIGMVADCGRRKSSIEDILVEMNTIPTSPTSEIDEVQELWNTDDVLIDDLTAVLSDLEEALSELGT